MLINFIKWNNFLVLVIFIISLIIFILFINNNEEIILFIFLFFSCLFVIYENNYFYKYCGLELHSFILIFFISKNKNNSLASLASIQYLIQNAISGSFFILSIFISILKGFSINFLYNNNSYLLIILLNISLLIKIGIIPFHYWVLYVYENIQWKELLILASISKIILLNIFYTTNYNYSITFFCVISVILSSILIINENKIKKILVWSSINNTSYMLLSINLFSYKGLYIVNIWIIIYMISLIFIIYIFKEYNIINISEICKIKNNRYLNYTFLILFCSIGALPPIGGFYNKLILCKVLAYNSFVLILSLILIFNILNIIIYFRIIYLNFFSINNNGYYIWKSYLFNKFNFYKHWLFFILINKVCFINFFYFFYIIYT